MNTELKTLIEEGSKYSAFHMKGLSNHLPMALYALSELNAPNEKLINFYEKYSERLNEYKVSDKPLINNKNWLSYFGDKSRFPDYLTFFRSELSTKSICEVLSSRLKDLVSGIATGAFHPLIRLAYAIEMKSKEEVAHSLAAWSSSFFTIPSSSKVSNFNLGLNESLQHLRSINFFKENKFKGFGVFSRLKQIGEDKNFNNFNQVVNFEKVTISKISEVCLNLYLSSNDNFTALHCVTGTHALRIVEPYFEDKKYLYQLFWQAIGACYIDVGLPEVLDHPVTILDISWADISNAALKSDDDHVFKFVYTCKVEFGFHQNTNYKKAAYLKVKKLL